MEYQTKRGGQIRIKKQNNFIDFREGFSFLWDNWMQIIFFILRFDYFVQATFKSRNEFPTLFMSTKCYSDVMHLAFYNLFNILFLRMMGIIILKVKNMSLCHDITSLRIKTHSRESLFYSSVCIKVNVRMCL